MLKFDEAVNAVHEWVKDRNDTLVVITADHETGGFGFSYSRKDIQPPSDKPGNGFANAKYHPNFNFGRLNTLDKLYQQKKSFYGIWAEAKGDEKFPTAESMMAAVNNNSSFQIDLEEAKQIIAREPNKYHICLLYTSPSPRDA